MLETRTYKDFARMLLGPAPRAKTPIHKAILLEQHLAVNSQTLQIAVIVSLASILTAAIARMKGADHTIWYWSAMCSFLALMALVDRLRRIGKPLPKSVSGGYLKRTENLSLLFGAAWGSVPLFLGQDKEIAIFVGILSQPAMMAGLAALLPSTPRITMRYTVVSGLGMNGYLAYTNTTEGWIIYTLLTLFIGAMYLGAQRSYNTFISNIVSRVSATEAHELLLRAVNATGQAFAYIDANGQKVIENDLHRQVFADRLNAENLSQADTTIEKSGRFWQYRVQPVDLGGFVVVHTDISEIERAKRELEIAKEEAEAGNAAKSRFLESMSRELKVPLDIISGCSEIMGHDSKIQFDENEYRNYADQIRDQAGHLASVIDEIISYSKLEHVELSNQEEIVDVEDAVRTAITRTMQALRPNSDIAFEISVDKNLPNVVYDRTALERIVHHLATNGAEHSINTPVAVKVSQMDGRGMLIMVRDQGRGMKPDDLQRAFDPFFQGESREHMRNGGGIGLGLTVSRKLARAHGGDIILRSSEGEGTSAFFIIPNSRCVMPQMIEAENLKAFFDA